MCKVPLRAIKNRPEALTSIHCQQPGTDNAGGGLGGEQSVRVVHLGRSTCHTPRGRSERLSESYLIILYGLGEVQRLLSSHSRSAAWGGGASPLGCVWCVHRSHTHPSGSTPYSPLPTGRGAGLELGCVCCVHGSERLKPSSLHPIGTGSGVSAGGARLGGPRLGCVHTHPSDSTPCRGTSLIRTSPPP